MTYSYGPTFYTILINNVSGYPQSAPNDGFIDANTVIDYANINSLNLETGISGFTIAQSTSKSKANYRYRNLLLQLNKECNISVKELPAFTNGLQKSSIIYTGSPNYNAEPASIEIHVWVERGDPSLQTYDELNPGTLITGINALNRFVVRALCNPPSTPNSSPGASTPATDPSLNLMVYDPTQTTSAGSTQSIPRNFFSFIPVDVGPVVTGGTTSANYTTAAGLITITKLFS